MAYDLINWKPDGLNFSSEYQDEKLEVTRLKSERSWPLSLEAWEMRVHVCSLCAPVHIYLFKCCIIIAHLPPSWYERPFLNKM